jgi:hypothetical protein
MTEDVDSGQRGSPGTVSPGARDAEGSGELESYEVDGGTVFFDPMNPLAWVETSWTVRLADQT